VGRGDHIGCRGRGIQRPVGRQPKATLLCVRRPSLPVVVIVMEHLPPEEEHSGASEDSGRSGFTPTPTPPPTPTHPHTHSHIYLVPSLNLTYMYTALTLSLHLGVWVVEATWAAKVVELKGQQVIGPRPLFSVTRLSLQMVGDRGRTSPTREKEEHSGASEDSGRSFSHTHTPSSKLQWLVSCLVPRLHSTYNPDTYNSTLDL